jgi:hypothetical protein
VYVGAILTLPSGFRLSRAKHEPAMIGGQYNPAKTLCMGPVAQWDLLGKSILDRVLERFRGLGVVEISVIPEQDINSAALRPSASNFWTQFEATIRRYLQFELETLLLVRLGPYVELDLDDLLRFHREMSSPMTQIYDQHGALDLVALDARYLARETDSFRSRLRTIIPRRRRYHFKGYANRLSTVGDFRSLARDALWGRSAICPVGREIRANVWMGEGARMAESVQISPPAYIGRRCRVAAGCIIRGASSIEQRCTVDCSTIVEDSCVLAGSYVGTGLNVTSGVICQETFFHLRRDLQLQFHDPRVFGKNFTGWDRLLRIMSVV